MIVLGASILCVVHLHTLFLSLFLLFVREAYRLLAIVTAWTRSRPRYHLFLIADNAINSRSERVG
jgi:hypothetical protein